MTEQGVKETKLLAGLMILTIFFAAGYNVFETLRHTVFFDGSDEAARHIIGHAVNGVVQTFLAGSVRNTGKELFVEFCYWIDKQVK